MKQDVAKTGTAQQILDVAQDLVQTRGYNAFSYADVARALQVTKASLHYHFPAKSDLGHSLIERYHAQFREALGVVDAAGGTMVDRLRGFVGIYAEVLRAGHVCLCGMLVAEYETLPRPMQEALDRYFESIESWLAGVLEEGRRRGEFRFDEPACEVAQFAISTLEGAMIHARSHQAEDRFAVAARRLLAGIAATP